MLLSTARGRCCCTYFLLPQNGSFRRDFVAFLTTIKTGNQSFVFPLQHTFKDINIFREILIIGFTWLKSGTLFTYRCNARLAVFVVCTALHQFREKIRSAIVYPWRRIRRKGNISESGRHFFTYNENKIDSPILLKIITQILRVRAWSYV